MNKHLLPGIVLSLFLMSVKVDMLKAESNPASVKGQWDQMADFGGAAVRGSGAFAVGQFAYVVSGFATGTYGEYLTSQVWQYSASANSWSRKRDFPGTARLDPTGFSIGQKGYFGLGSDNNVGLSDIWEYDIQTDVWTRKGDFPGGARLLANAVVIGEKAYVIGGGSSAILKDVWEYDPRADRWTRKADLPGSARGTATAFAIGNKAYYGLGTLSMRPFVTTRDFWEYDTQKDKWTRKADFPGPGRGEAIGFALGDKGYICSGMLDLSATGTSLVLARDLWEYNPQIDTWTKQADLPGSGRAMSVGFVIGSSLFIGTGSREDVRNQKDFWSYSLLRTGDLDRSGRVDAADLHLVNLSLAGKVRPSNAPFTAPAWTADMNEDGQLSAADPSLLSMILADNAADSSPAPVSNELNLAKDVAIIYLGHCGYAVWTGRRLLIFDYTEYYEPPPANRTLTLGYVNAEEIKDLDVTVFVSHNHIDHYSPAILEWEKTIAKIRYVYGWAAFSKPRHYSLSQPRATLDIDGVNISTAFDHHDDTDEVAFFVSVDGTVIFHGGDYQGKAAPNAPMKVQEDMRYLAARAGRTDLFFIGAWIGDANIQAIEGLNPRVIFPMHYGGQESKYLPFASDLLARGIKQPVICPTRRGDRYIYKNGQITQ